MTLTRSRPPPSPPLLAAPSFAADPPRLELRPGDHIAIIGNTLADRMQHDGWLETYLHTRFPTHDLVVPQPRLLRRRGRRLHRHAGLRTSGCARPRSAPDEWLTAGQGRRGLRLLRLQRVVRRQAGLEQFKKDLDAFIKHTLKQKYNGKDAPAAGPLLADRPRGPRTTATCPTARTTTPGSPLYTAADGRGRRRQRASLRRPLPADRRALYATGPASR